MIKIFPGDLLQISENNRFYYVIVLDKVHFFGGQLCFALYRTSETPLNPSEVLQEPLEGFYDTVDFIWAKREKRIERIAKKLDIDKLNQGVKFFKITFSCNGFMLHHPPEKANCWIFRHRDRTIEREIFRIIKPTGKETCPIDLVGELTEEEKRYPLSHCIPHSTLLKLIDQKWAPEKDPRL